MQRKVVKVVILDILLLISNAYQKYVKLLPNFAQVLLVQVCHLFDGMLCAKMHGAMRAPMIT